MPEAVVGKRDVRRRIRVGLGNEAALTVVGVVGRHAARPGPAGELAVGRVVVGRPLAVGIFLEHEEPRGFVVVPRGHVAMSEVLGAERRHGAHPTILVVGIPDRILCSALRGDIAIEVVGGRGDEAVGTARPDEASDAVVVALRGLREAARGCGRGGGRSNGMPRRERE